MTDLGGAPVVGGTVEVRRLADDVQIVSGSTDEVGRVTLSVPTGGVPVRAYLHYAKAGFVPANFFLRSPLARALSVQLNTGTPEEEAAEALDLGVVRDPTRGSYAMQTLDCNGRALGGVAITFTPATRPYYFDARGYAPDATATSTEVPYLQAWNVAPGNLHVAQTYAGTPLASYVVKIFPGEFAFMFGQP